MRDELESLHLHNLAELLLLSQLFLGMHLGEGKYEEEQ
jgi:hypothetical protein